jgi:hypothetical protein
MFVCRSPVRTRIQYSLVIPLQQSNQSYSEFACYRLVVNVVLVSLIKVQMILDHLRQLL